MVNWGLEIELIGEECRRQSAALVEELAEINRRTADKSRELAEQSAIAMRQFFEEHVEPALAARAELEEKERLDKEMRVGATVPEQREATAPAMIARPTIETAIPIVDDGTEPTPLSAEAREAIARSMAARKARDSAAVQPIDEPYDEESAYYRRDSWLD